MLDRDVVEVHVGVALVAHVGAHVPVLGHHLQAQVLVVVERGLAQRLDLLVDQGGVGVEDEQAHVALRHVAAELRHCHQARGHAHLQQPQPAAARVAFVVKASAS